MLSWGKAAVLLASVVVAANAQQQSTLAYPINPTVKWIDTTAGIFNNNGVYIAPDDSIVVSISEDCIVAGNNAGDGERLWTYTPDGAGIRCFGGVTFNFNSNVEYLVFSVTDEPFEIFTAASTRVIALNMGGSQLFSSTPLEGIGAGSPVTSFDGRHIYLTLNSVGKTIGHFNILDITLLEQDPINAGTFLPLSPIFNATNDLNPFSPIGIFHKPDEGYYDGENGINNRNDVLIWAFDTAGNSNVSGDGAMFGFQQPLDYAFDGVGLDVLELGGFRDWQASTPPVLTNLGRSMYWAHSRASFRAWVGNATESASRFSRGRTATASFRRGSPVRISARASPVLSSNIFEPMVYGPGPNAEFFAADARLGTTLFVATDSLIYSPAKVSPDDVYVYYVTENGLLYQVDSVTLDARWSSPVGGRVEGDIAMNSKGTMVYVATTAGDIYGYEVATDVSTDVPSAIPTSAPVTGSPSSAPSSIPTTTTAPSLAPSSIPTTSTAPSSSPEAGTVQPTLAPTFGPTLAPTFGPTLAPTFGPTLGPVTTTEPTTSPTSVPTPLAQTLEPTTRPTFEPTNISSIAPATMSPSDSPDSGAMSGAVASIVTLFMSLALLGL